MRDVRISISHFNGWSCVAGLLIVVFGCARTPADGPIVLASDPQIANVNGVTQYAGQPFTGRIADVKAPGDTLSLACYHSGLLDGIRMCWFAKDTSGRKQLRETGMWSNGKREGTHDGWWPNGVHRFHAQYANDLQHGTCEGWYPNGTLYQRMTYEKGYEVGREQQWTADGAIYANYIAKDGRKYGLTGVKNCANPRGGIE